MKIFLYNHILITKDILVNINSLIVYIKFIESNNLKR